MRKPFLLGLFFGAAIGALVAVNWILITGMSSPPVPPPTTQATPMSIVPVTMTPAAVQPATPEPMPRGAIPFEFNGQRYYLVPLDSDQTLPA